MFLLMKYSLFDYMGNQTKVSLNPFNYFQEAYAEDTQFWKEQYIHKCMKTQSKLKSRLYLLLFQS